jgi:phage recombination protein Bet
MNALTKIENTALAAMTEQELLQVLQSSLYPGAQLESIKMVLGYCKAAGLDPMQKPVHIVPMNVKVKGRNGERDTYEWRDTIMPGIGLYRTQAARSGELGGISEPEFGPDKTMKVGDFELSYPEWCKVTATRILANGHEAKFTACEYWVENYATAGKDTQAPNTMWKKRPRGQIAKCAQAQALRMAFPEMTGSAPTAEEMEGKFAGDEDPTLPTVKHMGAAEVVAQQADSRPAFPAEDFEKSLSVWKKAAMKLPVAEVLSRAEAANPAFAFTEQQKATILSMKKDDAPVVTFAQVADMIAKAQDADAIAIARDFARQVQDGEQRAALDTKADEREAALKVEG